MFWTSWSRWFPDSHKLNQQTKYVTTFFKPFVIRKWLTLSQNGYQKSESGWKHYAFKVYFFSKCCGKCHHLRCSNISQQILTAGSASSLHMFHCCCQGACGGSVCMPAATAASEGGPANTPGWWCRVPEAQIPGSSLSRKAVGYSHFTWFFFSLLYMSSPSPGNCTRQRSHHSCQRHNQRGLQERNV